MAENSIERGGSSWRLLFDEVVIERLKERSPTVDESDASTCG